MPVLGLVSATTSMTLPCSSRVRLLTFRRICRLVARAICRARLRRGAMSSSSVLLSSCSIWESGLNALLESVLSGRSFFADSDLSRKRREDKTYLSFTSASILCLLFAIKVKCTSSAIASYRICYISFFLISLLSRLSSEWLILKSHMGSPFCKISFFALSRALSSFGYRFFVTFIIS